MARNSRFRTTSGPTHQPSSSKERKLKKNERGEKTKAGINPFLKPKKRNFSKPFTKGKPFQKKDQTPENPSSEESKVASQFQERRPKSFSRERSGHSESRRSPGEGHKGKDFEAPRVKKSFIESRLDKQRKFHAETEDQSPAPVDGLIRLNKFISNSGVCSRREADTLITTGLITVNGKSVIELGYKVKLTDDVRYDGKRLKAEKPVYILLNKPKGYITTTDDPQERNTVMGLIQGACKERVYPVGRLDRNTSGLLLLTNDGDLTERLSHPSHNVKKIYKAELDRPLTKNDFQKILAGIHLEEGRAMVDDLAIVSDDGKTVGLEIHIGWNRIVRRIFESLDYQVVKLDRSVYATLDKKELSRGQWRFLRQDEVIRLKHFK